MSNDKFEEFLDAAKGYFFSNSKKGDITEYTCGTKHTIFADFGNQYPFKNLKDAFIGKIDKKYGIIANDANKIIHLYGKEDTSTGNPIGIIQFYEVDGNKLIMTAEIDKNHDADNSMLNTIKYLSNHFTNGTSD